LNEREGRANAAPTIEDGGGLCAEKRVFASFTALTTGARDRREA
jgi:hypothetical protein